MSAMSQAVNQRQDSNYSGFIMWHMFASALRIICKYCFAQVWLCPCLLYCSDFKLGPFLLPLVLPSSYLFFSFSFTPMVFYVHPFVHDEDFSPESLVRLVQTL